MGQSVHPQVDGILVEGETANTQADMLTKVKAWRATGEVTDVTVRLSAGMVPAVNWLIYVFWDNPADGFLYDDMVQPIKIFQITPGDWIAGDAPDLVIYQNSFNPFQVREDMWMAIRELTGGAPSNLRWKCRWGVTRGIMGRWVQ